MEKYIAFLRGINIGGRNKISMPVLKRAFEEIGFFNVVTYINSGNIIFSSGMQDKSELIRKIELVIADKFALNIPVAVVSAKELTDTVKHAPAWWGIDKESLNHAIFLIPPIGVEEVFTAVGEAKSEYEQVAYHGDVIFWSAPLKTFSKSRWSKIASSSVNDNVTIRNASTVNKVLLLIKQTEGL